MTKPRVHYISIKGTPDVYDRAKYADVEDGPDDRAWVARRLDEQGLADAVDYDGTVVTDGESLPAPEAVDAVMLGGSFHSINEGRPWQRTTMAWLERYRRLDRPLLGLCGGHQMMAVMAGMTVEPRPNGPKPGSFEIELTETGRAHYLFDGFADRPAFHFGNSDHVTHVPAGATLLSYGDDSPAEGLDYGGNWIGVQFHPEMRHDFLVRYWRDSRPEHMANYRALPDAPKLLVNFLRGSGII